ncbi:MAG: hypothetical protein KGI38_11545 [Thaumarchaeota archaeon]|nr:hypothetical protein [Nitrososphaerota archaeon]
MESLASWVLVFATWYSLGYPLTIGGIAINYIIWPLTHYGQSLLPSTGQAQNLLQWNYLASIIALGLVEFFELFVIPPLWWFTRQQIRDIY